MYKERDSHLLPPSLGAAPDRTDADAPPSAMRHMKWAIIALLTILAAGTARSVIASHQGHAEATEVSREQARTFVAVTTPVPIDTAPGLRLPGTLHGYMEAPVYARTDGYVRRWYADIGTRVTQGDLLAELDTPENQQQLEHANATHEQAAADFDLAKTSYARWTKLRNDDVVSQQELDDRRGAYQQAQARLAAADADVRRLQTLNAFQQIRAPFSGIVTARNIDVGDLVNSGNAGANRELFRLASTDTLRVYVYVPQSYSDAIRVGESASVSVPEHPGELFQATVVRTAGAIDTNTRQMQVEVDLPNKTAGLLPGTYVDVHLSGGSGKLATVPTNVLIFRGSFPQVAVVNAHGRVELRRVELGKDFGDTVEILSGVASNDRVILNPSDSIAAGSPVSIERTKQEGS